jgi:hypothetical protein
MVARSAGVTPAGYWQREASLVLQSHLSRTRRADVARPDRYDGKVPYRRCGRSGIQLPEAGCGPTSATTGRSAPSGPFSGAGSTSASPTLTWPATTSPARLPETPMAIGCKNGIEARERSFQAGAVRAGSYRSAETSARAVRMGRVMTGGEAGEQGRVVAAAASPGARRTPTRTLHVRRVAAVAAVAALAGASAVAVPVLLRGSGGGGLTAALSRIADTSDNRSQIFWDDTAALGALADNQFGGTGYGPLAGFGSGLDPNLPADEGVEQVSTISSLNAKPASMCSASSTQFRPVGCRGTWGCSTAARTPPW